MGASATDVAFRLAVSRNKMPTAGKHGADLFLVAIMGADAAACQDTNDDGNRFCRGLRLVLPFAVLVSIGGNAMRLGGSPPAVRQPVEEPRDAYEQPLTDAWEFARSSQKSMES